jgi:hypothetical protein
MAGLVDTFARRQAATAAAAPRMAPTIANNQRVQLAAGDGVSAFPIFNNGSTPSNAGDWTVSGPDGKPIPPSQWPNQNPDSADTVNQRYLDKSLAEGFVNMYRGQLNEGIAGLNDIRAQQMINQQARERAYGNISGAYQSQLRNQIRNADLDTMGVLVNQSNMPKWQGFLSEQWGNAMKAGKSDLDRVDQEWILANQARGIDIKEIAQGRREVDQQALRGIRDATSAATVGGVIQAAKQDYGDIEQDRGNALYGLDITDERSQLTNQDRRSELANRRRQLMGDLTAFDINTRESRAKLNEREQLLKVEAEKARLQPQMLMDQMNVTLQRLGLDRTMSTGQFLEAMANASAQERALISQFNQNAWSALGNMFG